MKRTRKIIMAICVLAMALTMTACGNMQNKQTNSASSETERTDNSETKNETKVSDKDETLIAYFSYSGNTEKVAKQIADYTGGTLAEIERATPYTDVNEEGEEELNSNARPDIKVNVDNIEDYKTVFIGYPIWWDEAPMVIDTFLESYDFKGKNIVPFCTSASDSIDNSLHIFDELAPDAKIMEGLTANDSSDIEPWLESLGYGK